jgi:hypothetical protein
MTLEAIQQCLVQHKVGPVLEILPETMDIEIRTGSVKQVLHQYFKNTYRAKDNSSGFNATLSRVSTHESFIDHKYYSKALEKNVHLWPLSMF